MNLTNKVTMDITRATVETTACPTWLVWLCVGLVAALVIGFVVMVIATNKKR